jgi:hypothetical protein
LSSGCNSFSRASRRQQVDGFLEITAQRVDPVAQLPQQPVGEVRVVEALVDLVERRAGAVEPRVELIERRRRPVRAGERRNEDGQNQNQEKRQFAQAHVSKGSTGDKAGEVRQSCGNRSSR